MNKMGTFDRLYESKKADSMTETQKNRQRYAIKNYYKKKNSTISKSKGKSKKK